ncbi:hypothetical protein PVAND_016254 [Polypedilum vanderplanki]|uniref:Thioredoxin domain-containing protein n=1 Tax=Polypedilum vanderplanki TaxID=319348 RepID=A0A9J6BEK6_POLVA|nr:hypothetical protein PVAND_016254 [Polypedilum vanderplanki]
MKTLWFEFFFIPFVSAVEINCEFRNISWGGVGLFYDCNLQNDPRITSLYTAVTVVNGNHQLPMNNEKVQGFTSQSSSQIINYIPHGLDKFFPNLISIDINDGRIKEIHQKDLEQYPKLKILDLFENDIEYLEKDLFKFNTELQIVWIYNNKITQIYPTIFDHLNNLKRLWLTNNKCINKNKEDRSGVLELIKEVKENCSSIFSVLDQLNNLNETNLKNFQIIKNQITESLSKILNLKSDVKDIKNDLIDKLKKSETSINQKFEITAKNMTDIIQILMKQQEKISMIKFGEQNEEVNQNLNNLKNETSQQFLSLKAETIHQFFFIALPLICLFTSLNIAMIYLCCRKYNKAGKPQKSSSSNDAELEERNLCPFSKKIAPVWIDVASSLKTSHEVKIAELECIKNKKICDEFNVNSFPTFKIFKNGKEISTFDTEKFNANTENFVKFAKSFIDKKVENLQINSKKSFAKCLG